MMKPTVGKSIFYIAITLAYLAWLPIVNGVKIMRWSINFYLDGTLSILFSVVHCLVFFYLLCILRSKQEKRSIVVSFAVFVCFSAVTIPFSFTGFGNQGIAIAIGILALVILLNMLIQSFRVIDENTGTGFKLLGITLALKVIAQMGLPFIWGYLADAFSFKFAYLGYIPPVLEAVVLLSIIFIFYQLLSEQKEQHYKLIHASLSETYTSTQLDAEK
ncbi:hypothetical protein [Mucilaginibacter sp. OK283]|uniref:hypothetical protein n=1 Tax=Mucilaginibacter sp. OK283 TaxID=1881049 RepID=UPI0008BFB4A7|nr:hypothetical protein [Mucilaginibacter sp. OK283]SEO84793.1 hypothetical protein SAMN05428947_104321 [Mucilaginibacter sp. OK283]